MVNISIYMSTLSFHSLFDFASSKCASPRDEQKEKIWKFINQYSHNDFIETNDDFAENTIGEGSSVILDLFEWIKELDDTHYQEMMKVVKK